LRLGFVEAFGFAGGNLIPKTVGMIAGTHLKAAHARTVMSDALIRQQLNAFARLRR
jgi:hypothetical protein